MAPGASCFFYTDGLTEHQRDLLAGEERLLSAIEYLAQRDLLSARDLHAQIIGDAANRMTVRRSCFACTTTRRAPVERYTFSAFPSSARLGARFDSLVRGAPGVGSAHAFRFDPSRQERPLRTRSNMARAAPRPHSASSFPPPKTKCWCASRATDTGAVRRRTRIAAEGSRSCALAQSMWKCRPRLSARC